MQTEQAQVLSFMHAAQQACPTTPTIPSSTVQQLRLALIDEEVDELWEAMVGSDIVKIADAIGDILYVVLGTAIAYGINIEPVFHEIHRSNMTKFIDGTFRSDGKYVKGPNYSKANIQPIIEKQQQQPNQPQSQACVETSQSLGQEKA